MDTNIVKITLFIETPLFGNNEEIFTVRIHYENGEYKDYPTTNLAYTVVYFLKKGTNKQIPITFEKPNDGILYQANSNNIFAGRYKNISEEQIENFWKTLKIMLKN